MTPSFRPFHSARGFASHVYLLCLIMVASLLSACGGGAGTVGIATGTALFSNAPPSVVLAASATTNFIVGGGTPTYTASSSNRDVATASMSGTTLTITAAGAGTATISVTDAAGATIGVPVTVNAAPVVPVIPPGSLFTTSSGSVTLAVGAASNFGIGGGTAPYAVSSSNTGVTTASVSGSNFTVTGVASGAAEVVVTDARGTALTLAVTVGSSSAPVDLFTTAPNTVTVAIGAGGSYNIGGGKPAYAVTSSNAGVARVALTGTSFSITGVAAGTSQVVVVDADGKRIDIAVVVGSAAVTLPLYTTAPDDVRIAVGGSASYAAGGGTPNYLVSSSNTAVARVAINGPDFLITGISSGTAQIAIFDAKGDSQKLIVTIGAGSATTALYTSASSTLVLAPGVTDTFAIGGGAGGYRASSSNSAVATAALSGGTAGNPGTSLSIIGGSAGTAQVVVTDAAGASVSIAVTVSAGSAQTALYTTAPGSVTLAVGASGSYTVAGGRAPYLAGTSNAGVATATISGGALTINGLSSGTAQVNVLDASGASVSIAVTVGTGGGALALYTTAPDDVRIAVGASSTYSAGGGTPAYQVSSSNTAVARVTLSGTDFQITGLTSGTAQIALFDAKGDSEKIIVTIGAGSTTTALYTSAASSLVLAPGVTESFAVGGGAGTYRVSSSNSSVATVVLNGATLSVTAGAAGVAQVVVTDAAGASVTVAVTVGAGSNQIALFTTAPGSVTVAVGASATYTVGGGVAPYSTSSSNSAVASAAVSGGVLTITANASGNAQINVVDATGAAVSIAVTSGNGSASTALFTSSSSTLVLATGTSGAYAVGGGAAPYRVSSSNAGVASAVLNGPTGNSLTITGNAAGVAEVVVTDAVGATVGIAVTVGAGNTQAALFTTAPDAVTIAPGASGAYAIGGGRAPYAASTSNAAVATVTTSANGLTISGLTTGTARITVLDAGGTSVSIAVTVGTGGASTALFTSAPGALEMAVGLTENFAIGGGSAPYRATSSNSTVATVSVSGSDLAITITGAGVAQVVVTDTTGASVSIVVSAGGGSSQSPLYTTAPAAVSVAVGSSGVYAVGGGRAPYRASSSNAAVATVAISGNTLSISGLASGVVQVQVTDAAGANVGMTVTVGTGNSQSALFTTAPGTITVGVGVSGNYTVGGGTAPYSAGTSNSAVVSAAVSGNGLTVTGNAAGTAQVTVLDATGASVLLNVTVGAGGSSALYTTAPAAVTIGTGTSGVYTVGGGAGGYVATTSNATVATVGVSGSTLTITPMTAGTANVQVFDSAGTSVTIAVTVTEVQPGTLLTQPGAATGNVGDSLVFLVSGGSPSYTITVSNTSIASVSPSTVGASGGSFMLTLHNVGTTVATITDARGRVTTVPITVEQISTVLRVSPSALQVAETNSQSIALNVYGGTGPYRVFTNNENLTSVSVSGSVMTIGLGSNGNRCINPITEAGAYIPNGLFDVTLTAVDSLGASATAVLTIKDNGAGFGVGCP